MVSPFTGVRLRWLRKRAVVDEAGQGGGEGFGLPRRPEAKRGADDVEEPGTHDRDGLFPGRGQDQERGPSITRIRLARQQASLFQAGCASADPGTVEADRKGEIGGAARPCPVDPAEHRIGRLIQARRDALGQLAVEADPERPLKQQAKRGRDVLTGRSAHSLSIACAAHVYSLALSVRNARSFGKQAPLIPATITAALTDLLLRSDLPVGTAIDTHFTPGYRQRTDGT